MPEFKPLAVYDRTLNRIWVLTRDCSTTEIRINDFLTILEDNHPEEGEKKCVGFMIEMAWQFCGKYELIKKGGMDLREALNVIRVVQPYGDNLRNLLLKILSENDLTKVRMSL